MEIKFLLIVVVCISDQWSHVYKQ